MLSGLLGVSAVTCALLASDAPAAKEAADLFVYAEKREP
jgi:hypothetical protein